MNNIKNLPDKIEVIAEDIFTVDFIVVILGIIIGISEVSSVDVVVSSIMQVINMF